MIKSKLTTKSQTTVPQPVREALSLGPGDEVVYEIDGDHAILRKAAKDPADDLFVTFSEWAGDTDRKAYADL